MVKVARFRGFLAAQEHADKVIAPPYDVLNTEEAFRMAGDNEKSFLHVNKPEIDLPEGTNVYDDAVYAKGKENLDKFVAQGWLKQDPEAHMYVYTMHMGEHVQHGLMCLSSVDDYEQNIIKKHEKTVERKEADRTKLTDVQSANIGPVFLTYLGGDSITAKINQIANEQEAYSIVTTDDGIKHILHRVTEADCDFFENEFTKIPATYVADGHHRTQAAYNVGKMRKQAAIDAGHEVKGDEAFNFFMTLIVPGTEIKCYEYNRLVKTLEGNTPEQFLEKMRENFEIAELPAEASTRPAEVHTMNMLLEEKWYSCKIKPELIDEENAVKRLDSFMLTELCLKPILGIEDLRKDQRIEFSGGIRGDKELERRCRLDCKVAFAMKEIGIADLLRVADSGEQMPPKSTWFEPKPRSGYIVRIFE